MSSLRGISFSAIFGMFILVLLVVAGLGLLLAYPTMWAINYAFSAPVLGLLFGGPLTFWKAFAINYVIGLFKSGVGSNSKD